jgi:hypothetical protein
LTATAFFHGAVWGNGYDSVTQANGDFHDKFVKRENGGLLPSCHNGSGGNTTNMTKFASIIYVAWRAYPEAVSFFSKLSCWKA